MSTTSLSLKSFQEEGEHKLKKVAIYTGTHSTGPPRGTILEFDVRLERFGGGGPWTATVQFEACEGDNPKAALRRLADWCKRAGEALDQDDGWWGEDALPMGNVPF